jgi:hypothetical protein
MVQLIPTEEIEGAKKKDDLTPSLEMLIKSLEMFNAAAKMISEKDLQYLNNLKANKFAESLKKMASLNNMNTLAVPLYVEEPTMTASELAEQCGVSEQLVRRACRANDIKAKRGKRNSWIIPYTELTENPICLRWLAEKQTQVSILNEAKERLDNELWYNQILKTESSFTDIILKELIQEKDLEGRELYIAFMKTVQSYGDYAQVMMDEATNEARNKKHTKSPEEKLADLFSDDEDED